MCEDGDPHAKARSARPPSAASMIAELGTTRNAPAEFTIGAGIRVEVFTVLEPSQMEEGRSMQD